MILSIIMIIIILISNTNSNYSDKRPSYPRRTRHYPAKGYAEGSTATPDDAPR